MTINTIFKCDKCGNEQNIPTQFWKVGITVMCLEYSSPGQEVKHMHVCRHCLESFGIYVKEKKPEAPPPPTIEDIIQEIVRNTINEHNS